MAHAPASHRDDALTVEARSDAQPGGQARLRRYLPILRWLPACRRAHLPGDFIAGMVLGVMAVPQSMAYALGVFTNRGKAISSDALVRDVPSQAAQPVGG